MRINGMTGMTLHCPLLEVVIRCSKNDKEILKMVNTMVANGVSLKKINVTFYEDIAKKLMVEIIRSREEQEKEFTIFEKTLEENPEWVDDSSSAASDSDNSDSDSESEDEDDDESEDEDGEESEVGDDNDAGLEEDGVDNNEDGNNSGMEEDGVDNKEYDDGGL